jgi:hypothetical protein
LADVLLAKSISADEARHHIETLIKCGFHPRYSNDAIKSAMKLRVEKVGLEVIRALVENGAEVKGAATLSSPFMTYGQLISQLSGGAGKRSAQSSSAARAARASRRGAAAEEPSTTSDTARQDEDDEEKLDNRRKRKR